MAKLLTIIGATGTQGGSVVEAALKDGNYKIRGVTRNIESPAAKALSARGVEMIAADANDEKSLVKAFEGSSAIFAVTDFFVPFATHPPEETLEIEASQGINLARAASKTSTLEHYIWSTLPDNQAISNGACSVPHFESKARVDEFIRMDKALHAKTTFLWVTFYATNIMLPMITPSFVATTGQYVQHMPASPTTPITTMGDTKENVGHYAMAILNKPTLTLPSKYVLAATETIAAGEMLKLWCEVTGKSALYLQVSLEDYDRLWPKWGKEVGLMIQFWEAAKEKSWAIDGLLTSDNLGVTNKLVGMEAVFKSLDWSTL
ncbi:hypothetical protein BP5796_02101 [Coleophoma crateriformis]|uniref:NmrA-like domain-containing protein n=1 Tax=Coleophoma crateriformis TaxID=565419 RepID=A0A3D8SXA4_9HELO|nr:hypothetical protein BP5796_02101 [Coleophoma crateriformis]